MVQQDQYEEHKQDWSELAKFHESQATLLSREGEAPAERVDQELATLRLGRSLALPKP
jgi:hypothetical protein